MHRKYQANCATSHHLPTEGLTPGQRTGPQDLVHIPLPPQLSHKVVGMNPHLVVTEANATEDHADWFQVTRTPPHGQGDTEPLGAAESVLISPDHPFYGCTVRVDVSFGFGHGLTPAQGGHRPALATHDMVLLPRSEAHDRTTTQRVCGGCGVGVKTKQGQWVRLRRRVKPIAALTRGQSRAQSTPHPTKVSVTRPRAEPAG